MASGIEKTDGLVLAMDLDQQRAQFLSRPTPTAWSLTKARERPSAARGPAKHQVLAWRRGQALVLEQSPDSMPGAGATRPRRWPAPRPAAPDQHPRARRSSRPRASRMIDLPAPVSPVSAVRPGAERQIEAVDQHQIADAEASQHGRKDGRESSPLSKLSGSAAQDVFALSDRAAARSVSAPPLARVVGLVRRHLAGRKSREGGLLSWRPKIEVRAAAAARVLREPA